MRTIPEPDWKIFRQLRKVALDRFCRRVLSEIEGLASDPSMTSHERYLAVYRRIHERDKEMTRAFNDERRSTAYLQLMFFCTMDLLTVEERASFSPESREVLERLHPDWGA